jgi:hypothetical protein
MLLLYSAGRTLTHRQYGPTTMALERDTFFASLDALTEKEIEQRLRLFDAEQLSLVQQYVDQKAINQIKAALQGGFETTQSTKTALAALQEASSANKKATLALIFALGGWLLAIAAVVAFYAKG